jgi:hypothetical protein
MADAWGENNWGEGAWGQQSSITVSVTGLSTTTAIGTESVVADALVAVSTLSMTSALGTATGEAEHVISPTGVSFETQLSGALAIEEGAGVVLGSLSMAFTAGDETASGSVDAGWGRGTWGSFAWNENIEFITNVSGVSMSTSLGTTTQEVGTGVIVTPTALSMTASAGTLEVSEATALVNPTALTIGAALSGATVSGEGSVGVIAPSDQLDFAIGTPVIDIFTQVDPTAVTMTTALGTAVAEADALVTLGSLSMTSALGTETVEVGTGVIVSVSTVALSFATGTETATGGAIVDLTGVSMATALGAPFSTPWANVVTGASNTWTEVDAA